MKPRMIVRFLPFAGLLLLSLDSGLLRAQTLQLSINPQTITFAAADPDITPQVAADQPVQVSLRATGMGNRTWQLTLRANGNLNDFWSLASISISNISWTATDIPPFRNGTLTANIEQIAARKSGNYNSRGDLNFFLLNLWTYWAGSYSQTVAFTLSAI